MCESMGSESQDQEREAAELDTCEANTSSRYASESAERENAILKGAYLNLGFRTCRRCHDEVEEDGETGFPWLAG